VIAAILSYSANSARQHLRKLVGMAGLLSIHTPTVALAGGMSMEKPAPYEQCGYCHEYNGNPPMQNYPKLAGQKPSYIIKQLRDYKHGRRNGRGMMQSAASLLSDRDMRVVADFYAKQKRSVDKQTEPVGDFSHARKLCTQGDRARMIIACNLCHLSSDSRIPYLKGQHADYLASQLTAFKTKTRTNDEATIMQFLAARLTTNEIRQISEYLAAGEPRQ
jgi:cytochrome c553